MRIVRLRARNVRRGARRIRWRSLSYVPAAVIVARKRRDLGVARPLSIALAYSMPVALGAALPRGRGRAAAVWAAHMWAYKIAFETPYDRPERMRERLHIDGPLRLDTMIGAGIAPTQRLQRAFRRPPRLNALDYLLTIVYAIWEVEPHAALAWILLKHPKHFPAAALRLGATFDATLAGYYLTPSAPPWWASEREGRMDREVRRVVAEVIKAVRGKPRPGIDHNSGANPWAAMPSDHFASAVTTARLLAEVDRRAGAIGTAYAAALALALVYTGEHYVTDLLAGGLVALGIQAVHDAVGDRLWLRVTAAFASKPPRKHLVRSYS